MKRLAIETWLPVLLWLCVIFLLSTDAFAAGRTAGIIISLLRFFFPGISLEDFNLWHSAIRKSGHITEYFVLAVLTYRSLKQESFDLTTRTVTKLHTLFLVVLAATFDEIHQGFTLFRTASPIDVGYDSLGAVWALRLITTYETRRLRTYPVL